MRRRRRPLTALLFLVCFLTTAAAEPATAATVVASSGDAIIAHDTAAGTWTLSAGGATLTLALDSGRDFAVLGLTASSGATWTTAAAADTFVRVGSQTLAFGHRASGFTFQGVTIDARGSTLQLNAAFTLTTANLGVIRHYAIVSGSPSFEAWTSFAQTSPSLTISDLNAITLTLPAGTIHWLSGLRGDADDVENGAAFTLEDKTLAIGQQFALGAEGRASEDTVPWFAVDGANNEFYAALMWSGAWSLKFSRTSAELAMSFGLAPMSTALQEPIDGPHVVFGVVPGGLAESTAALRSYILTGIRNARPLTPLVTYNTWFAYGTDIGGIEWTEPMAQEFPYLVQFGLKPMQAIRAATSGAAEMLDEKGDLGVVAAGAFADIIAVSGDPLKDVKELAKVGFVMKGGSVFKNELGGR